MPFKLFLTNFPLFQMLGPIPYWMANRAEKNLREHFKLDKNQSGNESLFDWPKGASDRESIKRVKNLKLIDV